MCDRVLSQKLLLKEYGCDIKYLVEKEIIIIIIIIIIVVVIIISLIIINA